MNTQPLAAGQRFTLAYLVLNAGSCVTPADIREGARCVGQVVRYSDLQRLRELGLVRSSRDRSWGCWEATPAGHVFYKVLDTEARTRALLERWERWVEHESDEGEASMAEVSVVRECAIGLRICLDGETDETKNWHTRWR